MALDCSELPHRHLVQIWLNRIDAIWHLLDIYAESVISTLGGQAFEIGIPILFVWNRLLLESRRELDVLRQHRIVPCLNLFTGVLKARYRRLYHACSWRHVADLLFKVGMHPYLI